MFNSLVKQAASQSIRRSVQSEAIFATQIRSYAAAKGGKAKGGKKGGGKKKELKNAFKQIPNRFIKSMPTDPLKPVTVPKIPMSLMRGASFVLKNVRVDKIELDTVEEGNIVVYPNMRSALLRLQPGLVTFHKTEDEKEKFYVTGGWIFIYYHGPVQLNCTEVYPLADLDIHLARVEIERCKELLKSREDKVRFQAQMAIEFLEPLVKTLEDNEF